MHNLVKDISINFLEIKIKNFLFSINLNEKYVSFEYLTWLLIFLIKHEDSNLSTYKQAISCLVEKYRVSSRTIIQGLHKIVSMCNYPKLLDLPQFKHTKTINKIRILKVFAENYLNTI